MLHEHDIAFRTDERGPKKTKRSRPTSSLAIEAQMVDGASEQVLDATLILLSASGAKISKKYDRHCEEQVASIWGTSASKSSDFGTGPPTIAAGVSRKQHLKTSSWTSYRPKTAIAQHMRALVLLDNAVNPWSRATDADLELLLKCH